MIISYICSVCGTVLVPKMIDQEVAYSKNIDMSLFSDSDIYFEITPCKCTYGNKGAVIKALKKTLDLFQD